MPSELRFDDRVAVVTGAGGGLGRAYALLLASRGAKVVVNDLGGSFKGEGAAQSAADKVVSEIKAAGGEAVANYNSVEDGEKIIKTAMDAWGRVDIVINNAGILRDTSFVKMKEQDWDLVYKVHLKGSYSVSKAAWNIMRNQKYGRIIMTTSAAGLYGNFGQANYSAAKLGILGLANTLSIEKQGQQRNILVNTIAPLAGTRMTETIMPPDLIKALKPETDCFLTKYIAPLVAFLCHESNSHTSGIFEVGAGWVAQVRRERSRGVFIPPRSASSSFTIEDVSAHWAKINDFNDPEHPTMIAESTAAVVSQLGEYQSNGGRPGTAPASLRFDGKVAIVTGAGAGLGREHALELARRGCKVVVNDLGGSFKGEGSSSSPAQKVCEEIKALGGEAVPNYDSVEFGERVVKTALDKWGRVDIVINNAGILRDTSFAKMRDQDWDIVNLVHLKGSYSVTKAAWNVMREQNFGRIVMTTSASGIYGNFGQANYSAAKLAILGMAQTLAVEGAKRNIFVNTIAPIAGTRMTESLMPPDLFKQLTPSAISPVVAFLAHESCPSNGGLFELGAGYVAAVRWERSKGQLFPVSSFSPEAVSSSFDKVTDFDNGETQHPQDANSSINNVMSAMEAAKSQPTAGNTNLSTNDEGNDSIKPKQVLGYEMKPESFTYSQRDTMLYALSVGAAKDPLDDSELSFVYENHPNFRALPTMGIIFPFGVLAQVMSVPGLTFNPMMLLHGEQHLEIKSAIPVEGSLTTKAHISGVYDKGKGVVISIDAHTHVDNNGSLGREVCFNRFSVFIRGIGGYNGDRGPSPVSYAPPNRAADAIMEEATTANQALIYRLGSGDMNPLHADPSMAAMGRFPKPILHGMCTYGHAARAVLKHFCDNDPNRFVSISARMSKHVFPGETLVTEMWKVADDQVVFTCKSKDRNEVVLANAVVMITPTGGSSSSGGNSASPPSGPSFKTDVIFADMTKRMKTMGGEAVKQVGGIYRFKVTGGPGGATKSWTVNLKSGNGSVEQGEEGKADCTITSSDDDMVGIFSGTLNPQNAFMQGKLKISGNMGLAMKLSVLTKGQSKM